MSILTDELTETALSLSRSERALLAGRILESLDESDEDRRSDDDWANIAIRRVEEVRSGKVQPIDGDVVFAEARERLRK